MIELDFEVDFCKGRKPGEKPQKHRREPTFNSILTYDVRDQSHDYSGEKWQISSAHHLCFPKSHQNLSVEVAEVIYRNMKDTLN